MTYVYQTVSFSPNVSTTPITAMGCRQCLPLSVVQLKGKHCRKPRCRNGVVDTFGRVRQKLYNRFQMFVSSVVGLHYSNILQAMLHTAQSIGSSTRAEDMSENRGEGALFVEIETDSQNLRIGKISK